MQKNKEAAIHHEAFKNILKETLRDKSASDWESFLDKSPYSAESIKQPKTAKFPREPLRADEKYNTPKGIFSYLVDLFSLSTTRTSVVSETQFLADHSKWEDACRKIDLQNKGLLNKYQAMLLKQQQEKEEFDKRREVRNTEILGFKKAYSAKIKAGILYFNEQIINSGKVSKLLLNKDNFQLDYLEESRMLIVEYYLPNKEQLPNLKEVKCDRKNGKRKDVFFSEKYFNEFYDSVLYQITLAITSQLYKADKANFISSIVFNGYVRYIDKATGKKATACLLSLQSSKEEFIDIDLSKVDPKECFRKLKGISSSRLYGLTPVAPVLMINRQDKRFVNPYDVVNTVDSGTNLASMDWQDFENLIREVFEREFSVNGGEVKITRVSRDEGVDAVAFDPDPIRGGKIIIQAKRYTNTVGVSAVRDLYGTVMNEGAMKGILVTTTDYGPDAYNFIKGKPLTLLNGANLLHILEKHGHKARIDIKEARKVLNLKEKTPGVINNSRVSP